jgi:hypothetical protein
MQVESYASCAETAKFAHAEDGSWREMGQWVNGSEHSSVARKHELLLKKK